MKQPDDAAVGDGAPASQQTGNTTATARVGPPRPPAATAQPARAPRLVKGALVGRYVVLGMLGEGGMGQGYAAYDPELSRKVALKLLLPDYVEGTDPLVGRTRLMREAQAMARLNHEHVVGVYDVGVVGDQVFVAMELVEGQTLRDWEKEKPHPWGEVLRVFGEAGRGLAAAHRASLVHRDFKPHNVLLTAEGKAKVTDFGLARATGSLQAPTEVAAETGSSADGQQSTSSGGMLVAHLTQVGQVVGTPAYMPPEQFLTGNSDAKGDIFSFAVALYEGLYGERPFEGPTFQELKTQIEAGQVRPAPRGTRVPPWVRRVVLKSLANDPAARHPTLDALLEELSKDPTRARRRALAVTAGVVFATGAAVTARSWVTSAPPACESLLPRLTGVWDPPTRLALKNAFLAVDVPWAQASWERVEKSLDTYAAQWLAAGDETCRQTKVERTQAPEINSLRVLCLERQHLAWRSLVDVFRTPDKTTVEKAISAVESLGSPTTCSAQNVVKEPEPPLPTDPKVRTQLEALVPRLAHAVALQEAGAYQAGTTEVKSLVPQLEGLADEPRLAQALFLMGQLAYFSEGKKAAIELAQKAAPLALATGQLRLFALMTLKLARWTIVQDVQTPETSRLWLSLADAAIRRGGDEPELRVAYWANSAYVLSTTGSHPGEVAAAVNRGLELARASLPADSSSTLALLSARADALAQESDDPSRAAALALAGELLTRTENKYGPSHPELGMRLGDACVVAYAASAVTEGNDWCRRPLTFIGGAIPKGSEYEFIAINQYVSYLAMAGRVDEGRRLLPRAEALRRELKLTDAPFGCWLELLQADLETLAGNRNRLLERAEKVLAVYGEQMRDVDVFRALTYKAWAYLDRGRAKEAVGILEKTLRDWDGVTAYAAQRPLAQFLLARALEKSKGDLTLARELAVKARASYARFGAYPRQVAEVDAWLQQHP